MGEREREGEREPEVISRCSCYITPWLCNKLIFAATPVVLVIVVFIIRPVVNYLADQSSNVLMA